MKEGINVLSLFDGMSCGRIALERAGIKVNQYFASEIDKHAMKVAMANYPDTVQLGDVTKVNGSELPKIHILIGGSPCQGFSFAGKGLNFEDPRSKLFFEFVRIKKELEQSNPDLIFLMENVQMKEEHEFVITRHLGIEPIVINSALLSAQNRVRLYWTNISCYPQGLFGHLKCTIPQPEDKGIMLNDILQDEVDEKYFISEAALARILRKGYSQPKVNPAKTGTMNSKNNSGQLSVDSGTTLILSDRGARGEYILTENKTGALTAHNDCRASHYVLLNKDGDIRKNQEKSSCFTAGVPSGGNHSDMDLIVHNMMPRNGNPKRGGTGHLTRADGKTYCLDTGLTNAVEFKRNYIQYDMSGKGFKSQQDRAFYPEGKAGTLGASNTNGEKSKELLTSRIRRLTEIECERLQTVPDNYTNHVSSTQRYKMLGNGWTIDVITHILSFMNYLTSYNSSPSIGGDKR